MNFLRLVRVNKLNRLRSVHLRFFTKIHETIGETTIEKGQIGELDIRYPIVESDLAQVKLLMAYTLDNDSVVNQYISSAMDINGQDMVEPVFTSLAQMGQSIGRQWEQNQLALLETQTRLKQQKQLLEQQVKKELERLKLEEEELMVKQRALDEEKAAILANEEDTRRAEELMELEQAQHESIAAIAAKMEHVEPEQETIVVHHEFVNPLENEEAKQLLEPPESLLAEQLHFTESLEPADTSGTLESAQESTQLEDEAETDVADESTEDLAETVESPDEVHTRVTPPYPPIVAAKRTRWTEEEDALLKLAFANSPNVHWQTLARDWFGNARSGNACKRRWGELKDEYI
jgi:hypothetical protein